MKKNIITILLFLLLFSTLNSLEINKSYKFENEEKSNFQKDITEKSLPIAIILSATIPGAGQFYLEQNKKVSPFLITEIFSIFALYKFNSEKSIAINNYKDYAYEMAGLRRNASNKFYNLASIYRSAEEHNLAMERYYKNLLLIDYITQEEFYYYVDRYRLGREDWWDWEYDSHFKNYRNIRRQKQEYDIYLNFAIGTMVLNRIISVLDAAISTNKINKHIYVVPNIEAKGLTFSYEYNF